MSESPSEINADRNSCTLTIWQTLRLDRTESITGFKHSLWILKS